MENTVGKYFSKSKISVYILDFILVTAVYFVPTFSHLLSLPLYYIEPMRLALVVSMIYTNRTNSFIIALTLPLFSYAVSAHPVLLKSILIASELLLNVFLYYYFIKSFKNKSVVFFLSIAASKIFYYSIKYILLQFVLLNGVLISTPILIQVIMVITYTACFYILSKKNYIV